MRIERTAELESHRVKKWRHFLRKRESILLSCAESKINMDSRLRGNDAGK